MTTATLSKTTQLFFDEYPEIAQYLSKQQAKSNFSAAYTPTIIEVKFSGLTYIRYENGKITATRSCSEGYKPTFWEVCFDEEEAALFVLGKEVLLDRTGNMAQLDELMAQCSFLDKSPQS